MEKKNLFILWGIILLVLLVFIIIIIYSTPSVKQNQKKLDNLITSKSMDMYLINNMPLSTKAKYKIMSITGNTLDEIIDILKNAKATINTSFRSDDKVLKYEFDNIYYLEAKDENNNIISTYYIYNENHLKQDKYVITLDNQKYDKLTDLLERTIYKTSGSLYCNTDNSEDLYLIANSVVKKYRNINYDSIENLELAKNEIDNYQTKYDGYNTYLIYQNGSYGDISDVYSFNIKDDTMALVKKYNFDNISDSAVNELLNTSKDKFINRSFEDIENHYPKGDCEYSLW